MRLFAVIAAVVIAGGSLWYFNRGSAEPVSPYRFVTLEQGDIEAVVASTGALDAVTTVQVGTQVSGIIASIYVDFNDRVRQGQVIARIDTTLLWSAVRDAESNLERNQAQLRQAERELERLEPLYAQQFVTEVDYAQAQYDLDIARATTRSADISLDRARQNLSYATIIAPISGTVIERNVDVGQTVAASFSAPQLFLIADDLSRMEILASVDESDIGQIREGQVARFTVQAYLDETFTGTVRQVRLQSTVEENVVNYTVVVDVENPDGLLLPGMTATVDFLIETATNVLKVPNAALRFRATPRMFETIRAKREAEASSEGPGRSVEGAQQNTGSRPAGSWSGGGNGAPGTGGSGFGNSNFTMLWYLDENGELMVAPAQIGITDGQMTEVTTAQLQPGTEIIAGVTQQEESGSNNPFQRQERRWRPGGF